MWAIAFVKLLIMLVCGGIYFWLGKVKNRFEPAGTNTSDGRIIIFAVIAVMAVSIGVAIVVPAPAERSQEAEGQVEGPRMERSQPSVPKPDAQASNSSPTDPAVRDPLAGSARTAQECMQRYATPASSMKNMEIVIGYCQSAFDPDAHPVDRAQSLCAVSRWTEQPQVDPTEATQACLRENPAPECPAGLRFQLKNKRCEVTCDSSKGYVPDASGLTCWLACPGSGVIYAGDIYQCTAK
ncbi:MAG: hypothetical protein LKM39_12675 [Chiayiivirga sp.]|jgi:hypothetical protein|nr:hypothetical protein [Chiayiivirga sp.]